jgi:hypothetical protein
MRWYPPPPSPLQIQIKDIYDQKLEKITAENFLKIWIKNVNLFIPLGLHTERPWSFSSQKRSFSTSKHEIFKLFLMFMGHFCSPGSGSSRPKSMRIRIQNTACDTRGQFVKLSLSWIWEGLVVGVKKVGGEEVDQGKLQLGQVSSQVVRRVAATSDPIKQTSSLVSLPHIPVPVQLAMLLKRYSVPVPAAHAKAHTVGQLVSSRVKKVYYRISRRKF